MARRRPNQVYGSVICFRVGHQSSVHSVSGGARAGDRLPATTTEAAAREGRGRRKLPLHRLHLGDETRVSLRCFLSVSIYLFQ